MSNGRSWIILFSSNSWGYASNMGGAVQSRPKRRRYTHRRLGFVDFLLWIYVCVCRTACLCGYEQETENVSNLKPTTFCAWCLFLPTRLKLFWVDTVFFGIICYKTCRWTAFYDFLKLKLKIYVQSIIFISYNIVHSVNVKGRSTNYFKNFRRLL